MSLLTISFLMPGTIGYLFLYYCLHRTSVPKLHLLIAALFFPLGSGIVSSVLFYSCLAAGGNGPQLAACLNVLLVLLLIVLIHIDKTKKTASAISNDRHPKPMLSIHVGSGALLKTRLRASVFVLLCLYASFNFIGYFWNESFANFLGGWDARYFWNLKARFYFRDPASWQNMFSPFLNAWGHPDYPLLLPGTVAWGWIAAGKEYFLWPMTVGFLFSISLLLLVFWYLYSFISLPAALAGSSFLMFVPAFRFWATTQYADIPLAFFFTASGLLLQVFLTSRDRSILLLSGILAGLSIWMKDEGYLFCVLLSAITAAMVFRLKESGKQRASLFVLFGASLALMALASIIIKGTLGTSGGQYVGSGRSIHDFFGLLFGSLEKSRFIASAFAMFLANQNQWHGLWAIFLAALVLPGRRILENYNWIPVALVLGTLGGYFAVMHVTPHDLRFQIETALLRLILHTAPLALVSALQVLLEKPSDKSQRPLTLT